MFLEKKIWKMPEKPEDVEFYDQVIRRSKATGRPIHLGRLFDSGVLKGSELPEGHANRKYKGRVVFGGNNVQDEYGSAAAFPEAGSGASYASASELLDAIALFPGNVGEQSDAPAAYTQAEMYEEDIEGHDTPTYVQLPEWQWNDAMKEAHRRTGKRPVCRLLRSLYGHPTAGLFWERKYKQVLRAARFKEMIGWECLFLHETYKVILSVYVDDFKMAGTKKGVAQAWKAIRGPDKLVLDEPQPFGAYLGCEQEVSTMKRSEAYERVQNTFPLVNGGYHAPEPSDPDEEVKKIRWHMKGFHSQCLDRYRELRARNGASTKLKEYAFPSIDDHQIPAEEFEEPGVLNKDAAKVS